MDMSFLERSRAPFLWMNNAEQMLGVDKRVELDKSARKSRAVLRLGKKTDLQCEAAEQISGGILFNISVGYSIAGTEKNAEKINGVPVFRV